MPRGSVSPPAVALIRNQKQTTKQKGECAIPPNPKWIWFPRAILMRENKYPFNPAYYQAHNDICKRRDTKRLYFSPLRIDLPHGRGAGATSFCAIEALLAVEKSVQETKKPRKTQRELPYHTAKQNDITKLCNVLFICPEPGFVEWELGYFHWALKKLRLENFYTISRSDATLTRIGTNNQIRIVTPERLRGVPLRKFSFFIIDEASCLTRNKFSDIQAWLCSIASSKNKILLVSYNPKVKEDWLKADGNAYKRAQCSNYKRYHADYRSMPKAWLGESFFKQAKMLKQANPKAYSEEYLGLPYKEPKKKVPHGTFRGKKYMERKKRKGKTK